MKKEVIALAAVGALAFGATAVMAQSTGGSAADPNTTQNQVPAPSLDNPADPAAGSKPAARVPTSPQAKDDAYDSGASGAGAGEAGSSMDPNSDAQLQKPQTSNPSP